MALSLAHDPDGTLAPAIYVGPDKPTPDRLVAIYARVSTPKQEKEGYSLDTQIAGAAKKIASEHPDERVEILPFREAYSGYKRDRPAFNRMLEVIRERRASEVWLYTLDRFERGGPAAMFQRMALIQTTGAELLFVDEVYENDLWSQVRMSIKAAIASDEGAKIQERTGRGKRHKVEVLGLQIGGARAPYGLMWQSGVVNGKMRDRAYKVPDPELARWVREIFRRFATGRVSMRELARQLNAERIPAPRAQGWNASTVHYLLRNEEYIGVAYTNKTSRGDDFPGNRVLPRDQWRVAPNAIRPDADGDHVVPRALWDRVDAIFAARAWGQGRPPRDAESHLLRGPHIRCGYCGRSMTAKYRDDEGRKNRYVCQKEQRGESCPGGSVSIAADAIDAPAWAFAARLLTDEQLVLDCIARVQADAAPRRTALEAAEAGLARQVDMLANVTRHLAEMPELGDALKDQLKLLIEDKRRAEALVEEARRATMLDAIEQAEIADAMGDWAEIAAEAAGATDWRIRRRAIQGLKVVAWVRREGDPAGRITLRAHMPLKRYKALLPGAEPFDASRTIGRFVPASLRDPLALAACFPIDAGLLPDD